MDELYIRLFGNKSKDIIFESSKINYVRVSRELINDYLKMVNNPKINKFISKKNKTNKDSHEINWVNQK